LYRPEFQVKGFASLDEARAWAAQFVHWYNHDRRHSGIQYVRPVQRHTGQDHAILDARHALYQQARQNFALGLALAPAIPPPRAPAALLGCWPAAPKSAHRACRPAQPRP